MKIYLVNFQCGHRLAALGFFPYYHMGMINQYIQQCFECFDVMLPISTLDSITISPLFQRLSRNCLHRKSRTDEMKQR